MGWSSSVWLGGAMGRVAVTAAGADGVSSAADVAVSAAGELSAVEADGVPAAAGLAGAGDDEQATAAKNPRPHNRIPTDLVFGFMVPSPVENAMMVTSSHHHSK